MIIEKDYRLIDGSSFLKGFYNPSPGNPDVQSLELHNQFLYAIWEDGDKTKSKIDSIEIIYDKENKDEEVGIYLWFGKENIYLRRSEEDEDDLDFDFDEDEDDEEGEDDVDEEENGGELPSY